MTTEEFITDLFYRVDEMMVGVEKHPQANLYPGEVVTLALLCALKEVGPRAFYRWLSRDYRPLFPKLPARTGLFRSFNRHRVYRRRFWAEPSLLGLIDSFGIELIHPRREGRSKPPIGGKGQSNGRWIVGSKLCWLVNPLGLIVAWACDTANVYEGSAFQALVGGVADQMRVFSDTGFEKNDWHPTHLKICPRGEWNTRRWMESILSMLTVVCHFKKVSHRVWSYFDSRLAYTLALFNLLVPHGMDFRLMKTALSPFPLLSLAFCPSTISY